MANEHVFDAITEHSVRHTKLGPADAGILAKDIEVARRPPDDAHERESCTANDDALEVQAEPEQLDVERLDDGPRPGPQRSSVPHAGSRSAVLAASRRVIAGSSVFGSAKVRGSWPVTVARITEAAR